MPCGTDRAAPCAGGAAAGVCLGGGRPAGRRADVPRRQQHFGGAVAGRLRLSDLVQGDVFPGVAGAAARAAPAVSGGRRGAVVRGVAAGGVCAAPAVGRQRCAVGCPAHGGGVRGTGVFAVLLGGLHAARLPRQYLSRAVPCVFCGLGGGGAARRFRRYSKHFAVAGGGGRGACLRVSDARGRRDVPFALCGGGNADFAGDLLRAKKAAPYRRAAAALRPAGGGCAELLRAEPTLLRRVCAVGFFAGVVCRRHGRDDAR